MFRVSSIYTLKRIQLVILVADIASYNCINSDFLIGIFSHFFLAVMTKLKDIAQFSFENFFLQFHSKHKDSLILIPRHCAGQFSKGLISSSKIIFWARFLSQSGLSGQPRISKFYSLFLNITNLSVLGFLMKGDMCCIADVLLFRIIAVGFLRRNTTRSMSN